MKLMLGARSLIGRCSHSDHPIGWDRNGTSIYLKSLVSTTLEIFTLLWLTAWVMQHELPDFQFLFSKSYGPYNSGNMFESPVWECVINSIIKSNFEFFDKMDIHQVSLAGPTWDKGFWRNIPTLNSTKSSLYNFWFPTKNIVSILNL